MAKKMYYVKSFEEDFALKTLRGEQKVVFQTLDNVMKTKKIRPNTKSFGKEMRLSTTILHENYLKTYRPQGLIFETTAKPDYVLPCDLVLLTTAEKMVVHYYRIKHNLHFYYNHSLMSDYEQFVFKTFTALIKKYDSPAKVWAAINTFRSKMGYAKLPKTKFRLVEYNEAVFHQSILIKPVAIFGYRREAKELAKRYGLSHYRSAKEFYQKNK